MTRDEIRAVVKARLREHLSEYQLELALIHALWAYDEGVYHGHELGWRRGKEFFLPLPPPEETIRARIAE